MVAKLDQYNRCLTQSSAPLHPHLAGRTGEQGGALGFQPQVLMANEFHLGQLNGQWELIVACDRESLTLQVSAYERVIGAFKTRREAERSARVLNDSLTNKSSDGGLNHSARQQVSSLCL